jgi:hypothetical protein
MDDAFLVRELECLANPGHDGQRLLRDQLPMLQKLPQGQPLHVFHDQERVAARLAVVVNGHDVRMVEPGQGTGLTSKPLSKSNIAFALIVPA